MADKQPTLFYILHPTLVLKPVLFPKLDNIILIATMPSQADMCRQL